MSAAAEFHVSMVADAVSTETRDASPTDILERFRSGKWRTPVEVIRRTFADVLAKTGDVKEAKRAVDPLKKKLAGVLWSGRFSSREKPAAEKLLAHSGLLCADLDDLGERLVEVRTKLAMSPHLWAMFTSPTGNGLKVVFRVPADAEEHTASFRAVEKHVLELTGEKIDGACKDVARLCFVSYDPDALLNPQAVELPPLAEKEKPVPASRTASAAPEIETRRRIAVELLGATEWSTDTRGFVTCPGQHLHTTGNTERDCEIHLDGAPTVHCFHNSCAGIRAAVNRELRSRIGKAEYKPQPCKAGSAASEYLSADSADDETITRLATLPPLEYERQRDDSAKRLGCRTGILDKLVGARRPKSETAEGELQGRTMNLADVEPWPESVSGADVLYEVAATFARFVALLDGAADALALWTAHTHIFRSFICSPRLNISSPEKGCGKTTLRDVLAVLVPRPLLAENLSVAVLFRVIEAHRPTVLADECDSWLRDNDELRGMLNSGHRRGGQALRCEGESNQVRAFNVFAPSVLCGIGALPGTLHDRSIVIRLERAKPGELRERFDSRRVERETELCRKLARFCGDNAARLEACDPALPLGAFNRLANNWRPLFAVAEIAGGDWPQRAAAAFTKLTSRDDVDAQGIGSLLLADVAELFSTAGADKLPSSEIVKALAEIEGRPWAEWGRAHKPMSANQLANQLRRFGVVPRAIRVGDETPRGYLLADFVEAFDRYLAKRPAPECNSATTPKNTGDSRVSETQHTESMLHPENATLPRKNAACCNVADRKTGTLETAEMLL